MRNHSSTLISRILKQILDLTSLQSHSPRRRPSRSGPHNTTSCIDQLESRLLLTAVVMTDNEQLLLELINRARANPSAEAARFAVDLNEDLPPDTISTAPKAPLAPHQSLVNAAQLHSQDMLDRDFFDHLNPDELTPVDRGVNAGYPTDLIGENIAFAGTTGVLDQTQEVYDRHEALFLSSGHRENMLAPAYVEVGTGIRYGIFTEDGTDWNAVMATENFGIRTVNPFITGVVYTDSDNDDFYSVGEAIRTGIVSAIRQGDGSVFSDEIGYSGGYRLSVPPGTYDVAITYTVGQTTYTIAQQTTIGTQNVKVDFDTTDVNFATFTVTTERTYVEEIGVRNAATVTVTRNGNTTADLRIMLTSTDTTELSVPTSITIPAGQSTVTFTAAAVVDGIIDGNQATTITVAASGYAASSVSLSVIDWDIPQLPAGIQQSATARPEFAWTAVTNAARYELWINIVAGGQTRVIHETNLTATSYTPAADMALGTYLVWVRGITANNVLGKWGTATTWQIKPLPVNNENGSIQNAGNFSLTWTPVFGATEYDVWIDQNTPQVSQYYRNTHVVGLSVALSNFPIGSYTVWVRARNAIGEFGYWSAASRFQVSTAPSGLRVNAASLAATPELAWNDVPGAALYDVWIDNRKTGASQVIRDTSVAATSLLLSSLTQGAYRASVRGRDVTGGNHLWSIPFDFDFQSPPQPLSPGGNGQISSPTFRWTNVSGATRYELWVSSLDLPGRVIHETNITTTQHTTDVTLNAGNYRIWIRAFDPFGNATAWSSILDFSVATRTNQPPDDDSQQLWLTEFWSSDDALQDQPVPAHIETRSRRPATTSAMQPIPMAERRIAAPPADQPTPPPIGSTADHSGTGPHSVLAAFCVKLP